DPGNPERGRRSVPPDLQRHVRIPAVQHDRRWVLRICTSGWLHRPEARRGDAVRGLQWHRATPDWTPHRSGGTSWQSTRGSGSPERMSPSHHRRPPDRKGPWALAIRRPGPRSPTATHSGEAGRTRGWTPFAEGRANRQRIVGEEFRCAAGGDEVLTGAYRG